MKEIIKKELDKHTNPQIKRLALAEFLQHLILQSLYRQNAFKNITFTGGTALRLLYNTGRYSEDLDFSFTENKNAKLETVLTNIKKDLGLQGLKLDLYTKSSKTVFQSDFRFRELLRI